MTPSHFADGIIAGLYFSGLGVFLFWRGKALLLFLQQEEYDALRFRDWFRSRRAFDVRVTAAALLLLIAIPALALIGGDARPVPVRLAGTGMALAFLEGARVSARLLKRAKKPLVMTARAKRIFWLYLLIAALTTLIFQSLFALKSGIISLPLTGAVLAQIAPGLLMAANALLRPHERRVNARYRAEAVEKLARIDPFIIGVTGSFGKTSTKALLSHILSSVAPTLATPGSVNTEMGITRIIREQLRPEHRWFIVEMGAYGPGSIARLCRLAPPRLGVITAVGDAHYERFKSLDTVFDAKFELADAVGARGGRTIVVADAVPAHMLESRLGMAGGDSLRTVGRGEGGGLMLRLLSATQEQDGISIEVMGENFGRAILRAPLFGLHQADNILAAAAAALSLGLPIETVRAALATAPQTRHRLEVQRAGGISIIDDAYNSNPKGFASALALLDLLVKPGGRRILVTPGMVELGARHDAEHARLGALAARHVDVALIVTPERIERFAGAFAAAKTETAVLHRFARQADAEAWIKSSARPGDAILYENNLPDLYEARPAF